MKKLLVIILFIYSHSVVAKDDSTLSFFAKKEMNGNDYVSGVGVELLLKGRGDDFGVAVNSSIGKAEITDQEGLSQHYIAWDVGMKFGYFSMISLYGEVGFDLAETIFQDRDDDHEFSGFRINDGYDHQNDIDGYVGIGAGINLGHVNIEAFSRLRQIDGNNWKSEKQGFSGIKIALSF